VDKSKITILGIGNLLMGDEGVGIHVIRQLEKELSGEDVDVVDGGTRGLNLLEYFIASDLVVLVDATCDGKPPGTITCQRPSFSSDYPRTLVAHDLGLKDLLDALELLEAKPEIVLFTVSIGMPQNVTLDLSPEIQAAILPASQKIRDFLATVHA
jgi:hydrogenase maturation protease